MSIRLLRAFLFALTGPGRTQWKPSCLVFTAHGPPRININRVYHCPSFLSSRETQSGKMAGFSKTSRPQQQQQQPASEYFHSTTRRCPRDLTNMYMCRPAVRRRRRHLAPAAACRPLVLPFFIRGSSRTLTDMYIRRPAARRRRRPRRAAAAQ